MKPIDYWKECIAQASEECELSISEKQLTILAEAVQGAYETYDMTFYTPSGADKIEVLKQSYEIKLKEAQDEYDLLEANAKTALKHAMKLRMDSHISLQYDGEVYIVEG